MAQRLIRALTESSLQWRVQYRVATTISGGIAMRFALDDADLPIPRPKPAEALANTGFQDQMMLT